MAGQTKGTIGVGVIGAGSVADLAHFPSLKEIEQVQLVATCDPVAEYRDRAKKKWSVPHVFTDYQDLLKLPDVQLVIIASPNVFHREQAVAALQAGKDVIIEKPFACTNREAWDIVEAAKKSKRRVMVGCNYRFWEQHLIAKDLLSRGVIGELKQGTSKSHEAWSLYHEMISYTRFRADAELAGAGALFDLGSHMTDLLIWLMGSKPKRVCGTAKNLTRPSSYTTLDDCVFIQIEFENGACGVVDLYASAPLAVYSNKDFNWEDLPDVMRDYRYPQVFWAQDNVDRPLKKRWIPIYPPRGWAYKKMIQHFADCIVSGKEPIIRAEDGAVTMEVLCAVFASMRKDGWVDLPLKEEVIPPGFKVRT